MLMAIAGGWYAADEWVHERQFDYIVSAQNTELKQSSRNCPPSILAFVAERSHHAPPPPRPATWNDGSKRRSRATRRKWSRTYERRFGKPTRIAHDVLRQLGIRDRDLDVFYAHPANAFQMRIVGTKLAALSARVPVDRA